MVRTESIDAERAIEAALRSMPSEDVTRQLEKLVADNPRLARSLATLRQK